MIEDDVPEIADLAPSSDTLDGKKVSINSILNIPLVFTGWEIRSSKINKGEKYMTLQFLHDGTKHVCFTGSVVLIAQIEAVSAELEKRGLPRKVKGVIRHIDKFYKFCRTDE